MVAGQAQDPVHVVAALRAGCTGP